jgi:hypothetical protein
MAQMFADDAKQRSRKPRKMDALMQAVQEEPQVNHHRQRGRVRRTQADCQEVGSPGLLHRPLFFVAERDSGEHQQTHQATHTQINEHQTIDIQQNTGVSKQVKLQTAKSAFFRFPGACFL